MTRTHGSPTTTCPDEGRWRAWLDSQVPDGSEVEAHLATCQPCRATVDDLTADSTLVASALNALEPVSEAGDASSTFSAADLSQARRRLADARRRTTAPQSIPTAVSQEVSHPVLLATPFSIAGRLRVSLTAVAAAAVLTFVVGFTPQGQALATSFLAQFRSERIQVLPFDTSQIQDTDKLFKALANLGTVQQPGGVSASGDPQLRKPVEVKTLAEASQQVGFTVKQPTYLPQGVARQPSSISASKASEARFTFSVARARTYFESINRPDVQLPAKYDGASLVVSIPSVALLTYANANGTDKSSALIVGQAGQLQMGVESANGVTLDDLRTFLLSLPGLPPEVTQQLRAIQDWRNTLPLPVPVDKVTWKQEKLAGVDGLILDDKSGMGSGALWQKDGQIFGVGGAYKSDEIRRVADSVQ